MVQVLHLCKVKLHYYMQSMQKLLSHFWLCFILHSENNQSFSVFRPLQLRLLLLGWPEAKNRSFILLSMNQTLFLKDRLN